MPFQKGVPNLTGGRKSKGVEIKWSELKQECVLMALEWLKDPNTPRAEKKEIMLKMLGSAPREEAGATPQAPIYFSVIKANGSTEDTI